MHVRFTLLVILITWCSQLLADEPSLGPAIEGYGPTFPINDRDVPLEEGARYKAVFDVGAYSNDLASLNYRLVSVARYLNMHARNGVAVEKMDLAVVVHGTAVKNLMTNDAYQARYGSDNPNLDLLEKLQAAGVHIYVCGQSMAFGGVEKSELANLAKVGLSAMTIMTVLQNDGYALLP